MSDVAYRKFDKSTCSKPSIFPKLLLASEEATEATEFDPSNIILGKPVVTSFGTKVPLAYQIDENTSIPITLQSPSLYLPFGYSEFEKKKNGETIYDVSYTAEFPNDEDSGFLCVNRYMDYQLLRQIRKQRATYLPSLDKDDYDDSELWKLFKGVTRKKKSKDGSYEYDPQINFGCPPGTCHWDGINNKELKSPSKESVPIGSMGSFLYQIPHMWISKANEITIKLSCENFRLDEVGDGVGRKAPEPVKKKMRMI